MFMSLATNREENLAFFWMRQWTSLINDLVILIGFPPACRSSKLSRFHHRSTKLIGFFKTLAVSRWEWPAFFKATT
jgi:hypothetical protein